jgi:uncharacterized FlgJ-related protein
MRKSKRTSTNSATILLGSVFFLSLAALFLSSLKQWINRKKMITISKDGGTVYRLLKAAGFQEKFAQWITAQAAHETANFTSPIYQSNNNAFGMKFMNQKTALGEKNGYAYYENIAGSVADYKRLYKSYGFVSIGTVENFIKFLKSRQYFEANENDYLTAVKYFLNLYFPSGSLDSSLVLHGASGTW